MPPSPNGQLSPGRMLHPLLIILQAPNLFPHYLPHPLNPIHHPHPGLSLASTHSETSYQLGDRNVVPLREIPSGERDNLMTVYVPLPFQICIIGRHILED